MKTQREVARWRKRRLSAAVTLQLETETPSSSSPSLSLLLLLLLAPSPLAAASEEGTARPPRRASACRSTRRKRKEQRELALSATKERKEPLFLPSQKQQQPVDPQQKRRVLGLQAGEQQPQPEYREARVCARRRTTAE